LVPAIVEVFCGVGRERLKNQALQATGSDAKLTEKRLLAVFETVPFDHSGTSPR